MLYFIRRNDNLASIARKFGTTIESILRANFICNPSLIFQGQPLIIPESSTELPRAGAGPYYIVQPGDTLYCISKQTNISISTLTDINGIKNPNIIYAGAEILLTPPTTDSMEQLKLSWDRRPDEQCMVYGFTEHGVYYNGTFEWAAFGSKAIPYLFSLLKHRCDIVRRYALVSLGRIAPNGRVKEALEPLLQDTSVSDLVRFVIRRIDLNAMGLGRIHVNINDNNLYRQPDLSSEKVMLPKGTEFVVLRWFIPSPTAEEGPIGGLQIYDYVEVVGTGQKGFVPRLGHTEITFM